MVVDIEPPRAGRGIRAVDVRRIAADIRPREIAAAVFLIEHIPPDVPPVPGGDAARGALAAFARASL